VAFEIQQEAVDETVNFALLFEMARPLNKEEPLMKKLVILMIILLMQ